MSAQVPEIDVRQAEIIAEFALFSDWTDRYEYLIDLGKALPPLDPAYRSDAYLVKGCQSQVWLHADERDGRVWLSADSDTVITKGIIALLIRVLSGLDARAIIGADLHFIEEIGLKAHLSPTRSNGLQSMIRHIRSYAERLAPKGQGESDATPADRHQQLIDTIKTVYDPEIPVDIWELGLIYDLAIDDTGKVHVTMTLTSPACPVAGSLPLEVQEKLMGLPFVTDVELSLVWEPAWSKERMSDEARLALDMF
jgi:cysteine desulfuration protein SufE